MLTSPQLETAIDTALDQRPAGVVVDFTDVEFLASAGMGVLVAAHDKQGREGSRKGAASRRERHPSAHYTQCRPT